MITRVRDPTKEEEEDDDDDVDEENEDYENGKDEIGMRKSSMIFQSEYWVLDTTNTEDSHTSVSSGTKRRTRKAPHPTNRWFLTVGGKHYRRRVGKFPSEILLNFFYD